MHFDIEQVPFSRFGSYMTLSIRTDPEGEALYLRTVHGDRGLSEVFRISVLMNGDAVDYICGGEPNVLTLQSGNGTVSLCMAGDRSISILGQNAGLRLTLLKVGPYGNAQSAGPGRWHINAFENRMNYELRALDGELNMDAPFGVEKCDRVVAEFLPNAQGRLEAVITEFLPSPDMDAAPPRFEPTLLAVTQDFETWRDAMPPLPAEFRDAGELAAYVMWSAVVAPGGHFKRPAMLMSKNHMTNVWSWDHAFNAMALAASHPQLAWDQLMIPFDLQDASGALPDCANDALVIRNFTKPPIHGWALRYMLAHTDAVNDAQLADLLPRLELWTEWWFKYRDSDGDGIPQYNHGNDSGWDNSSSFDIGFPLEGPDLCAYLILQMDALADVCARLKEPKRAANWKSRADDLQQALFAHSWRDGKFTAPRSGDHALASDGDSLFPFLPLVLGERLPPEIRAPLLAAFTQEGRFITPFGLATESPNSPRYQADGYWRGPIWAPPVMLIVDGLKRMGEGSLAALIARRFCQAILTGGMAENFDALTGAGLRDRAYTWTPSVFLMLARDYLDG